MSATVWALGLLAAVSLLLLVQLTHVFGRHRGALLGLLAALALGGGWWLLARPSPSDDGPADWSAVASVPADTCAKCHQDHYDSWRRTYHRAMTREATPENVKGDFADAVYDYQGLRTRLTRQGDAFFMDTVDPNWALFRARAGERAAFLAAPRYVRVRVDRLVGSHWIQECLHEDASGRYSRLPVLYHIAEHRWVHSNGAFLAPDTDDFWGKCRGTVWNNTCLYCHNTGPVKNPVRDPQGQVVGYRTRVAELGIACEACHGPGGTHVALNHNPARRLALQQAGRGDPSIAHPGRLPVPRRDEICARCHGALVPKPQAWDPITHRDPFVPGQELTRYNWLFWSEAEQAALAGQGPPPAEPTRPGPTDGRFWGDGTPLTTALEYNGLALSACYQNGRGRLSCLSCHAMHADDPNFLLKPGMQTNEACYQCHADYRGRLTEHTHHAADSPGSLCYNCHMPYQVYSLLTTHRSHRIQVLDIKDSLDTGKPHACNLCHLDKSLGWTQEQLGRWSDRPRGRHRPLSGDEAAVSEALLLLARGDARSRVVVAGAFASPAAQRASGTDWFGPFLTRLLEDERYPAVRYLAHRGLRGAYGEEAAAPFDYLAVPAARAAQLRALRARFDATPVTRPLPYLPLTPRGLPDEAVLRRLREGRQDPDLTINE
jgi:predicted CXXCH cytochrome family protein